MPNPHGSITDNQDRYIRENHRRMSVREMADNLKLSYSLIYGYMTREQIEIRVVRNKKAADHSIPPPDADAPEGYFRHLKNAIA